ncbi:MAG: phosphopantothenoylcysteine decarboxylase [Candidatus Omnitrophica bacterium]|nr:phosphopantothenoylcysteine decarboxylase [Candidatus Omnitrophota bacterium]
MKRKRKLKILVSAGPTREPIDPVRFISNYSTGFLGYEIAKEASRRGHRVILVSGPTALVKPPELTAVDVETSGQMQDELKKRFSWCDCLIMTAAVCDFRPKTVARRKIRRCAREGISLELKQNSDILAGLGRKKGRKMLIGFALETEELKKYARGKLRTKNLDLIVATQMKSRSYPFGQSRLKGLIMDRKGHIQRLKGVTKPRLSRILLEKIENLAMS